MDLADADEETVTDVSLITGALRATGLQSSEQAESESQSSSLVPRNQTMTVANANTAGGVEHSLRDTHSFLSFHI